MVSQSPQLSQSSQYSPLCLSLLKFSYATVSNDSVVPIPWIHLSSKNALFAIFETCSVQLEDGRTEDRQKFKVLKDPEIMEELDLNALATEANRVMAEAANVSSAQIPIVAVIVKVPMIAIKYPLANGQIRRFQIRFGKNEDYYEAMKMLSRANVPTVEAGTFPTLKSQTAPRQAPANLVVPDDSASQTGLENANSSQRKHNTNDAVSSISASRQALIAMPPPQMHRTTQIQPENRPPAQSVELGNIQISHQDAAQPAYPKSNISLSTATTLVPERQGPSSYNRLSNARGTGVGLDARGYNPGRTQRHESPGSATIMHARTPARDEKPDHPRQDHAAQLTGKDNSYRHHSARIYSRSVGEMLQSQEREPAHQAQVDHEEPSDKPSAKGRAKRSAANTKKAPAAKKPRAATSTKKKTKSSQQDEKVPTVAELLQQPGYSLLPYSASIQAPPMPCAQSINQKREKTMEIAESEHGAEFRAQSLELGQATTTRVTRSASRALAAMLPNPDDNQPKARSKAGLPPCTPADQIMATPLTPASPAGRAHPSPPKAMHPPPAHQQSSLDFPTPNLTAATAPDDALLSVAQQCMSLDENFDLANADSRLEAWANLPDHTKMTAMRSYFCELLMQDSFVELVKCVSGLWEGAILEGRVNRDSMRGVDYVEEDGANE